MAAPGIHIPGVAGLFLGTALLLSCMPASSREADRFWHASAVSAPVVAKGKAVEVRFRSPASGAQVPGNAVVTRVNATRVHQSDAWLQTELCAGSGSPCVSMNGPQVTTDAFRDLPAGQEFLLRHKVLNWGPSAPPLYIRSELTVWFRPPSQAMGQGQRPPADHPE